MSVKRSHSVSATSSASGSKPGVIPVKEALFYRYNNGELHCVLCPHNCMITAGQTGRCGVRKRTGDKLYALTYATHASLAVDPIEKKPLYHFYPGKGILSTGTYGCNFICRHCQNWEISQVKDKHKLETIRILTGEQIVELAKQERSVGVAYTYNEPLINYEWLFEMSKLVHKAGMVNVVVTNGFINKEPLSCLAEQIDAANVDLKAFSEGFYRKICGGALKPVLNSIESMLSSGIHVELTTLLIPGHNDSAEEIVQLVNWIARLDKAIPLHFSRYFPKYKMDIPVTDEETLIRAYDIAKTRLDYVYLGNYGDDKYGNTYCPGCKALLISRVGYEIEVKGLTGKKCTSCGYEVNLII
ncbi:MAG: AmmeMemoRadiSam system radical SAM enzyme [Elusimicrobiota bacterium]